MYMEDITITKCYYTKLCYMHIFFLFTRPHKVGQTKGFDKIASPNNGAFEKPISRIPTYAPHFVGGG